VQRSVRPFELRPDSGLRRKARRSNP
jgi:hypothetical protein